MAARPLALLHGSVATTLLPLLLFRNCCLVFGSSAALQPLPSHPCHICGISNAILLPTGTHRCEHHPPDRGHWGCHKGTAARAERPLCLRSGAIWLVYVKMSCKAAFRGLWAHQRVHGVCDGCVAAAASGQCSQNGVPGLQSMNVDRSGLLCVVFGASQPEPCRFELGCSRRPASCSITCIPL
jgi:hypothetical protein